MRTILLIISVLVSFSTATAQEKDARIKEVLQAAANYDAAWNKKDVAAAERFLAPEYVYFSSTGTLSDREETLKFLKSPDYVLTFVERSEFKAFRNGDTVVVSSRWKGKGKYGETEINDDQRCGQVFVRSGGKWKILSEHCVQIQPRND